jgi:hypothetical protein
MYVIRLWICVINNNIQTLKELKKIVHEHVIMVCAQVVKK